MNRQLFIQDFKSLASAFDGSILPEVIADYVQKMPYHHGHQRFEVTVNQDKVIGLCCQHFKMSLEEMAAPDRHEEVKHPRQVTMYLLLRRCRLPHRQVADLFNRDRSTVTATKLRMDNLMETDLALKEEIETLNGQL